MCKKIIALLMATILSIFMCVSVSAASVEDSADVQSETGETAIGNMIVGESFEVPANGSQIKPCASCPDYYSSVETAQLHYSGYIQFKPSYTVKSGDGYKLKAGYNVCQAAIDYQRYDKSVIGGKKYTTKATSKSDTKIYSTSASCFDDLLDWSAGATTVFYVKWFYFA